MGNQKVQFGNEGADMWKNFVGMGVECEILASFTQFESNSSAFEQNAVRRAHEFRKHLLPPTTRQTGGKNPIWIILGKANQEIPGYEQGSEGEI